MPLPTPEADSDARVDFQDFDFDSPIGPRCGDGSVDPGEDCDPPKVCLSDHDKDGFPLVIDNCPASPNLSLTDDDLDGVGNDCELELKDH